jgi:hypothetical protein
MFGASSINWCELDYVKSEIIAEYWNTLTGIFLCISSIYALYNNYRHNITSLEYSNVLLFFVGIGTMLFHGTLIYFWQLWDEIPMMLIVIEYYRIITKEIHLINHINLVKLNYQWMFYSIPIIILSYYINPKLQVFTFQGSLVCFIMLLIYTCYKLNSILNRIFYQMNRFNYVEVKPIKYTNVESETELSHVKYRKKRNVVKTSNSLVDLIDINNSLEKFKIYSKIRKHLKYHNYQGISLLIFSLVIWNIDNHFCQHNIELHAIWHITTSIGMYSCNEILKSYILLNKELI